jgi:hypothetical protein
MTSVDVQRSIRRWLWMALGDAAWTLRDSRFEVPDDQRPAGYVDQASAVSMPFARSSVPQGDVQMRTTFSLQLYPSVEGSAEDCDARARRLADELGRCVVMGVVVPGPSPVVLGGPLSLPLWDFEGVSLDELPVGPPVGVADVDSVGARAIPDPLDDRRWTVAVDLRVSWWTGGRSRLSVPEEIVADVPGFFVGSGEL